MQAAIPTPKPSSRGLLLKGTLLSTSTLTVMAGATIAPSLPAMQEVFAHVPNVGLLVRLVLTLPALFMAIGAPLAGAIIDRFGRKRLLVAAILLYGVAGGTGIVAPTLMLLLMGRGLMGFAVAGIRTCGTTLIADYYRGAERAQMMGLQAAFAGLGGTLFLTLGGFLAEVSWRGPFYIYLFAFVVLPFVFWVIYEPERTEPKTFASDSATSDAKLPLRLLVFIYAIIALTQLVFYLVPVQLPFHLQKILGATSSQTGSAIATTALFYALASMSFGWFGSRIGRVPLMIIGFLFTGVGYGMIGLSWGWIGIVTGLILGGFGMGLIIPNLNLWLADEVPVALRGRALGGFTTSIFLGQFLSPFISQPLAGLIGISNVYKVTGIALLALVALLFVGRQRIQALGKE